jgi:hypothetical protein
MAKIEQNSKDIGNEYKRHSSKSIKNNKKYDNKIK